MIVQTTVQEDEQPERMTGKVKWFNNKSGFGFVTACEGEFKGKDIFVHYSSINVPDEQYKYLVQGEYVDFDISESEKSEHEFHAVNVSGVKGGELMCETRRHISEARPYKPRTYKTPDDRSGVAAASAASAAPPRKKTQYKKPTVEVAVTVKDSEGFVTVPVRRTKPAGSSK